MKDMENKIARLSHNELAIGERCEILEKENGRLSLLNIEIRESEEKMANKVSFIEEERERFRNIAIMQMEDFDAKRLIYNATKVKMNYMKDDYDDLKKQLMLVCRES